MDEAKDETHKKRMEQLYDRLLGEDIKYTPEERANMAALAKKAKEAGAC